LKADGDGADAWRQPPRPPFADGRDQRHADGGRDAGAADHLHGGGAPARCRRSGRPSRQQGRRSRQEQKPVQISIDPSGTIFVDETPVPEDGLGARLAGIAAASREEGGPRIYLRADRQLDYGRVMSVMGEINNAGLRKVALVSTQGPEG
jgi:hypothetical protein